MLLLAMIGGFEESPQAEVLVTRACMRRSGASCSAIPCCARQGQAPRAQAPLQMCSPANVWQAMWLGQLARVKHLTLPLSRDCRESLVVAQGTSCMPQDSAHLLKIAVADQHWIQIRVAVEQQAGGRWQTFHSGGNQD